MRRFSDSVLIIASSAKRFLCRIPTDKNTARRAAEGFTESRKTRVQESAEPREKPDGRFYDSMRNLSAIGNNINQLAAKAHTLGFIDVPMLKNEANRWHRFQANIEATFLRPAESKLKWE